MKKVNASEGRYFPRNSWNRTVVIVLVHLLHFEAALPLRVTSARLYPCSSVWRDGKFLQTWDFLFLKQCFSIDPVLCFQFADILFHTATPCGLRKGVYSVYCMAL